MAVIKAGKCKGKADFNRMIKKYPTARIVVKMRERRVAGKEPWTFKFEDDWEEFTVDTIPKQCYQYAYAYVEEDDILVGMDVGPYAYYDPDVHGWT